MGHGLLAISGIGAMAHKAEGMVGDLYAPGDARRDSAFTIFYMGINVSAFLSAFVCGDIGRNPWMALGFGAAAAGMLMGIGLYMVTRSRFLKRIGDPPPGHGKSAPVLFAATLAIAAAFGLLWYHHAFSWVMGWLAAADGTAAGHAIFVTPPPPIQN